MTWFLDDTPAPTGLPPVTAGTPSYAETIAAGFREDRLRRNVWNQRQQYQNTLLADIEARVFPGGAPRVQTAGGRRVSAGQYRPTRIAAALQAVQAARNEEDRRFRDLPTTEAEFEALALERLRADYEDAVTLLGNAPEGRVGAATLGGLASGVADPMTLATLPFGANPGMGIFRAIAVEASLGGATELLDIPRQREMAEVLGIEEPNVTLQVGVAAATAGVLGGGVNAAARYWNYRMTRGQAEADLAAPGATASQREAQVTAAEDALAGGRVPAADPPMPGEMAARIRDGLISRGMSPHVAEAFLWNFRDESRLNPGINEIAPIVPGSRGGFGLAQWTGPRRRQLEDYAAARGLPPSDLDVQLDWLMIELRTSEVAAGQRILSAPDTRQAAAIIVREFLRPLPQHQQSRATRYLLGNQVPDSDADMPVFTGPTTRGYTGAGQVVTGGGRRVDVQYEVVDIATLRQATGDLQPRDRSTVNSDAWVAETAARLDPALLMPAPTADRGTPIVGPDGIIESGNGRVRAITMAYDEFPDRATAYRGAIEQLTGQPIPEGIQRPVLIARRTSELDDAARRDWVIEAQDSGVAELTPIEAARVGARRLTTERLNTLDLSDPDTIFTTANAGTLREVLADVPASQRNALFDRETRQLNSEGKRRVRAAMFARAWDQQDVIRLFVDAEDSGEFKGMLDALSRAAPDFAVLRAEIEAGLVDPAMDITSDVLAAMRIIAEARELARTTKAPVRDLIEDVLTQGDVLAGSVGELTAALVRRFYPDGKPARADDIAAFLRRYATEAREAGRLGGFLADVPSLAAVLRAIDPKTFADLPDDFTRAPRGVSSASEARTIEPAAAAPFDRGAASPEAEESDAIILDAIAPEALPMGTGRPALAPVEDLKALDRAIRDAQPIDTIDDLYRLAPEAQEFLTTLGARIADELGVEFKNPGLKQRPRAEDKMRRKGYASPREMTDIARGGFLVRRAQDADAIVAALAREAELLDEGWKVTPEGYFDRKVVVRAPNGLAIEVQIWSPELLAAKQSGGGHKLYVARDNATDPTERTQLDRQMQQLYADALAREDASFAGVVGTSNAPKVLANIDRSALSSRTTPAVWDTSDASTSTQGPPGLRMATAEYMPDPRNSTAGRLSQSQSTRSIMGDTSSQNIGANAPARNGAGPSDETREVAARRADPALAGLQIEGPDGITRSADDILADIEEDMRLADVVEACMPRRTA